MFVNSMYSFWWDVTNDWGLSLLTPSGWSSTPSVSYAFIHPPAGASHQLHHPRHAPVSSSSRHSSISLAPSQHHRVRSTAANNGHLTPPDDPLNPAHLSTQFPPPPSRPVSPLPKPLGALNRLAASSSSGGGGGGGGGGGSTSGHRGGGHSRAFSTATAPNLSYPFLRPILLLPDPAIYYLCICLDLILRLTWSLKLSSHLHSAQEVESGLFLIELMEVFRRWMWVYLRIEWEAVRKGAGSEIVHGDTSGPSTSTLPPLFSSSSSSGGLGRDERGAGGAWLDKGDGEARLRAQEEYELAALRQQPGSSRPFDPDAKVAPVIDIPSRV